MSSRQARSLVRNSSRSTALLGRHLEKHLLAYAAAASAGLVSAALPAEAQIIYTPSNTPMAIAQENQGLALTPLDLNNDGTPDFTFAMLSTAQFSSGGTTIGFKFFLKVVPGKTGNEAVQGQRALTAAAMLAGATIGPQQKFGAGDLYLGIKAFNGFYRNSGTWQNVEFAYVGLKFLIKGQVHYGWARVKFPFLGGSGYPEGINFPSIYGYAYESTPNQPIVAGQTSGTLQENTRASSPASLGMLAAGASGMNLWRTQNSANDVP
jgi:hypothetical protein